jgi:hypothetical protein
MKRKYSQIRDVVDGKTQVENFYTSAVIYFSKGFGIVEREFPMLRIVQGEDMAYNQVDNEIRIGDEEFISDIGSTLGEELGHFIRAKLKGRVGREIESKEAHADEFYGFLGRKILFRYCSETQRNYFFSDGDPTFENNYEGKSYAEMRHELLHNAKKMGFDKLKREYKEAEKIGDKDGMKEIFERAKELGYKDHFENLLHLRPYSFATNIDLNKTPDLVGLYSLSDQEVRRKFFREDKKYDLETEADKHQTKSKRVKGLEAKLVILGLGVFFLFVTLSNSKVTGYAIRTISVHPLWIKIIFAFISLIFGGYLSYKLITKK